MARDETEQRQQYEQSMSSAELANTRYFPRWIHVVMHPSDDVRSQQEQAWYGRVATVKASVDTLAKHQKEMRLATDNKLASMREQIDGGMRELGRVVEEKLAMAQRQAEANAREAEERSTKRLDQILSQIERSLNGLQHDAPPGAANGREREFSVSGSRGRPGEFRSRSREPSLMTKGARGMPQTRGADEVRSSHATNDSRR